MGKDILLIVEDEADLRVLLAEKLEDVGYEVYQAGNGEDGLKLAEKYKPDLVISNVVMPKKDGNWLFKELRKTDFGKNIPFLVLTAHGKMKEYFEAIEVDGFLEKPIASKDLIEKVEKILERIKGHKPIKKKKDESDIVLQPEISDETERIIDDQMITESKESVDLRVQQQEKQVKKKKILIIEDDSVIYQELRKIFSRDGHEITNVTTSMGCIKVVGQFLPDLIIAKQEVSGMKLEKLIEIIRKMSGLEDVPLIVYDRIGKEIEKVDESGEKKISFAMDSQGIELLQKASELLKK